jgi:carbon-monoxide dehydrogenase small subunit
MLLRFTLNGRPCELEIDGHERLVDILRNRLNLTGTKESCGIGECGACTVIMDKKAVNSCLVMGCQIQGKEILTIEGLQVDGEYDALQKTFVECGAVQCGYCTPGMIMSAKALLMENSRPSETEIRRAMAGNLCRCTGYVKIIAAIKAAAEMGRE